MCTGTLLMHSFECPKLMKTCEQPGIGFDQVMEYRSENEPCYGATFPGIRPTLCESTALYDLPPCCCVLENFCNVQVTLHPKEIHTGCNKM